MKVIRKTIVDEIDKEIKKGGDIVRIELTLDEFNKFINEVIHHGKWHGYTVDSKYVKDIGSMNLPVNYGDWSGSHVFYKGICIQTHEDY